jgi:hypothetical protein
VDLAAKEPIYFGITNTVQAVISLDTNVLLHHLSVIRRIAPSPQMFFFHGRFVGLELAHICFDKSEKADIVSQIEARGVRIERCHEMFERGFPVLYGGRPNSKTGKAYPSRAADYADVTPYEYNRDLIDFTVLVEAIASFRELSAVLSSDVKYVFMTADVNLMRIATDINNSAECQKVFEPTFAAEDLTRWTLKAPQSF